MMWGYSFDGGWFIMMFGGVLLIAVLVVLAWALIRWFERKAPAPGSSTPANASALEILRQRYARGEIDTATYEQMREQLQVTEHSPDASLGVPESRQRNF